MKELNLTAARIHAHDIGNHLHTAYWMESMHPNPHHHEYQLAQARMEFVKLAEELGYEKPVLKAAVSELEVA